MFCKNCGLKLDDDARFCPNCGTDMMGGSDQTKAGTSSTPPQTYIHPGYDQPYQPYQPPVKTSNTIALVGFILSFFFSIAGLICSIIGYKNADQYEVQNKGLATAGIIISAVSIGFTLMFIPISCAMIAALPY